MCVKDVVIQNQVGLHARPATFFIQKANEFKSSIWGEKDERKVNAKSLLGVLSLGIIGGTSIPERSQNYRDLCYHLFSQAQKHLVVFRRAMDSTGFNSLHNFIYEYSYQAALKITQLNRNGEGFTPVEELQVDVFCNGICAVYRNMAYQRYQISASEAADALFEMMPESLKHYWWK